MESSEIQLHGRKSATVHEKHKLLFLLQPTDAIQHSKFTFYKTVHLCHGIAFIPSRVSGRGYKIGPVCMSVCPSVS